MLLESLLGVPGAQTAPCPDHADKARNEAQYSIHSNPDTFVSTIFELYTYLHTQTYIHTYIHTYTHTYIDIHTDDLRHIK